MSSSGADLIGQLPRYAWWTLIGGILFFVVGVGNGLWFPALAGFAALGAFGWLVRSALGKPDEREPFPWPSDLRAAAEGMARPIDPEPKRLLPPDEKAATIAKIAPIGHKAPRSHARRSRCRDDLTGGRLSWETDSSSNAALARRSTNSATYSRNGAPANVYAGRGPPRRWSSVTRRNTSPSAAR